nr:ataxin-7-like protein 2b isoform X1 [Misgurnus anguillicaudatus]
MVAERARAETVMAALDRRISILDFVGQGWDSWIDKADVSILEGPSVAECSKLGKKRIETMTLKKEDMSIYGHCPAHDDFFLVVCCHCGQVVKPQAFERHCERRHGPLSKLYRPPSSCSPDRPQQGRPPSQHPGICAGQDKRCQDAGPPRVPPPHSPHQCRSTPQCEGHSPQLVDKISNEVPPSTPKFSTPSPRDSLWHQGPTPPKASSPAEKPLKKGLDSHSPLHGPRTYSSRTYKNVLKKDCDLDKHCGVMDPERNKLCTRLLTCNIHSIHQRRQVAGRSKAFDQLVLELKMNSKPRERPPLPHPENSGSQFTPLLHKCQITNSSILRSLTSSESGVDMEQKVMRCEDTQVESLSAVFSSDESDDENREEFAHLPASIWHPKPLGLCTFGARVLGRSVLAFDRRLLHLRSAFTVMMDQHLSTFLWKKIPRVSELCSYQPTNSYNSHDATSISRRGQKASCLRTTTSGKSEPQGTKLLKKAKSVSGPGRPRNPMGRTSKQSLQATFRELQETPTASKRLKSLQDEDSEKATILYTPHHKDQQPSLAKTAISSSHGPFNGSKSHLSVYGTEMKGLIKQGSTYVSTPITPSAPSESDNGLNQRTLGYEPKGRKRKTSCASPPKNTSCIPKSIIRSSLSKTHSSVVSWGEDARLGANSNSLPKKLGAQKPKLLH